MPKFLSNIDFELVKPGWWPVAVSKVAYKEVATGDNAGSYRIALTLNITEGPYEGRKLFDSVMLAGKGAPYGRRKLETLCPAVDWGDFDFPEGESDVDRIHDLEDELLGASGFAQVKHVPSRDDPRRLTETVDRLAPASADIDWEGNE